MPDNLKEAFLVLIVLVLVFSFMGCEQAGKAFAPRKIFQEAPTFMREKPVFTGGLQPVRECVFVTGEIELGHSYNYILPHGRYSVLFPRTNQFYISGGSGYGKTISLGLGACKNIDDDINFCWDDYSEGTGVAAISFRDTRPRCR